jgi:SAM-dependent methyltransferase
VTALEPGTSLISLARQNLEDAGEVEFVNAQFEDARLPRKRFRAVFAASAFHWADPEVSWQRAADVLVPGGTLALVQYFGMEEARTRPDQDAALAAIAAVAPDIAASWPAYRDLDATLAGIERRRGNISRAWSWLGSYDIGREYAGRLFGDVQAAVMPKLVEHTPGEVGALVRTMSFYARLSADQRQALDRDRAQIEQALQRASSSHYGVRSLVLPDNGDLRRKSTRVPLGLRVRRAYSSTATTTTASSPLKVMTCGPSSEAFLTTSDSRFFAS